MASLEVDETDGAIVFKEDGTVNIIHPQMMDEDIVPDYLQFAVALGMLVSEQDSKLYKYIWESWDNRVDPDKRIIDKDFKEIVTLMSELEELKKFNVVQIGNILRCFCVIARGWEDQQVKNFIRKHSKS